MSCCREPGFMTPVLKFSDYAGTFGGWNDLTDLG